MSRDIKFRAWDEELGEMLYTESEEWFDDGVYFRFNKHEDELRHDLMQYTGLKDENEKEIYEGDILSIKIYSRDKIIVQCKAVVEFKDGCFGVIWGYDKTFLSLKSFFNTKFEVVGNKYENPELLEGEE
ncbi:YopX family protein [Clostridium perfringens]|uniref:YopX family protein n=1 Tax=Clostridium perfringens TaxID=1502 RepID=UPI001D11D1DA|nr:YopX family protein [Clostridium perfringens]MCC2764596.1 YopX family protein [Clostridium perfringens]MCG4541247.1 YopX family protein [Clostridium perfringens]MCG4544421.1 YopX family protein [Clostridium perfringens]MCG4552286.1 YopX family protein [Clostridium perfringens]MCG4555770.1 YopX family protein [Clostridium perfringens]